MIVIAWVILQTNIMQKTYIFGLFSKNKLHLVNYPCFYATLSIFFPISSLSEGKVLHLQFIGKIGEVYD